MAEPGTTPPPQTRSNSSTPVAILGGAGVSSSRPSKASPRTLLALDGAMAPGGRACNSSTRVFHAPHAGHWPAHLVWTAPQDWQAETAPSRVMALETLRFGVERSLADCGRPRLCVRLPSVALGLGSRWVQGWKAGR